MKLVCAWCQKVIKEGNKKSEEKISHGICPDCYTKLTDKIASIEIRFKK